MKHKVIHKLAVLGALSLATLLNTPQVMAQGWDTPPEVKAQIQEKGRLVREGEALVGRGHTEEGLAKLNEAKRLERAIPGFFLNDAAYALARALTALGRPSEALTAFKDVLRWDRLQGDVTSHGNHEMMADYAILLAQQGRIDDAKAVYYATLRFFNRGGSADIEPIPYLVVFDPDPTMTVWEPTAEKIVLAATMLRAAHSARAEGRSFAKRAKELDPSWLVPPLYLARNTGEDRDENVALARNLARTDEEREWMRTFDIRATRQSIGVQRRAASTVLQVAKRQLATTHTRIASGRINPG